MPPSVLFDTFENEAINNMEERIGNFKVSSFNSGYNRKVGFNSGYNKKIEKELQVNDDATDSANIIACYS